MIIAYIIPVCNRHTEDATRDWTLIVSPRGIRSTDDRLDLAVHGNLLRDSGSQMTQSINLARLNPNNSGLTN